MAKKSPAQLQREIDEALSARLPEALAQSKRPRFDWASEGFNDLNRQGFMRAVYAKHKPAKVAKVPAPQVGCAACLNWHAPGKHTASLAVRKANLKKKADQRKDDEAFYAAHPELRPVHHSTIVKAVPPLTFKHEVVTNPLTTHQEHRVTAYRDGLAVGKLHLHDEGDHMVAADVSVRPSARRTGVATAMYHYARETWNKRIMPNKEQTAEGKAMWASGKLKLK